MSSRLSVVFYIILCLEIGLILTVLPWVPHGWLGLSDWGNNYFLLLAAHRTGYGVQRFVSSGWIRGAVSGLGILNLAMGFWELTHFRQTVRGVEISRGSFTKVLVNDRADIAAGAGADGVHLSTRSLGPKVVRAAFGRNFMIGASTHSLAEATAAREGGADFAVLGPVFETKSKAKYGPALGLAVL